MAITAIINTIIIITIIVIIIDIIAIIDMYFNTTLITNMLVFTLLSVQIYCTSIDKINTFDDILYAG